MVSTIDNPTVFGGCTMSMIAIINDYVLFVILINIYNNNYLNDKLPHWIGFKVRAVSIDFVFMLNHN